MIVLLLTVWQILCMKPGATLPSPTKIWSEAYDLIVDPFFVAGPQDIGLGWRVLISLQRVAIGYGFAAVIGVMLGTIIGQSVWAMRGLDPIFQVLRTISPLAWLPISLAAFRDSQPSAIFVIFITSVWPIIINTARRHPQYPAGLSQRRAGAAAQSSRILLEDHDPVGGALHLHGAAHRHRSVMARHRRGGNARPAASVSASSSGMPGTRRASPTSSSRSPTSAWSALFSIASSLMIATIVTRGTRPLYFFGFCELEEARHVMKPISRSRASRKTFRSAARRKQWS